MRMRLAAIGVALVLVGTVAEASAQRVGELFRTINPSVAVVRAKGRDVTGARGIGTFTEPGSGVLISDKGEVMTAAHVGNSMDGITAGARRRDTVREHG